MDFVHETEITAASAALSQFSAGVMRSEILRVRHQGGLRAHRFSYPPGGHSHWHIHEGEQAIFVLAGRGVLVRWGEAEGTRLEPGSWVHVEPGEKHWHGASADDIFIHVAVTASGATEWHETVTELDYRRALGIRE